MIVDDEPPAIKIIESYMRQVKGLELTATCASAVEAFALLQEKPVDLLFLDINMPKMSGLDLVKGLTTLPKIIITTAYRDYAMEGYELDVVDYLLKPISFNRFLKAIAKANRWLHSEHAPGIKQPEPPAEKDAFLYFKVDKQMIKVFTNDILYVESMKDYVKLHCHKEVLIVKQSISSLEELLSGDQFVRLHRSFIVAVRKIQSFTALQVTVEGKHFPIGRLYKNKVLSLLETGK
jgi:DNA-binding LytR/AlgR family response regulator